MKIIDFFPLDSSHSTYGNPRQAYAQLLHTYINDGSTEDTLVAIINMHGLVMEPIC